MARSSFANRRDSSRQALLEIVGFWSPAYRAEKLARLRKRTSTRSSCVSTTSSPSLPMSYPSAARIVRYSRRIRPEAVLDVLED
jgi:predicted nuclease of restriction endonuclease-like RecB superfamily